MHDLIAVMRKEWKEIVAGDSRRSGLFRLFVLVFILGVFLPTRLGADWLHSMFAVAMAGWIPIIMIVAVIADSFAGERERHTLETLLASRLADHTILFGKLIATVLYGLGITAVTILVSGIAVNLAEQGDFIFFDARRLAMMLLLASLTSLFAASAGVLVSLRAATVRQAQQTLSIAAMVLVFVPSLGIPALPAAARGALVRWLAVRDTTAVLAAAALVLLVLDLLLVAACMARFRRNRLILS